MDPWLIDTCFDGGWGLRYKNERAMDLAGQATHLWISHFHSDHFHVPTLKMLARLNPDILCLGNHSYNFRMDEALTRLGFRNVQPLLERVDFRLNNDCSVLRYPTTGIDNMLLIKTGEGTVLNFNDCNVPGLARRWLARAMGPIAVFLNNFNHASRLLVYPLPTDEQIQARQKAFFVRNFTSFNPRHVIPFASHHYFRAEESQDLNPSLLTVEEILSLDRRIIPVHVGESVEFSGKGCGHVQFIKNRPHPEENTPTFIQRGPGHTLQDLQAACDVYRRSINHGFFGLSRLVPPLRIEITDLKLHATLSLHRGLRLTEEQASHIEAHSAPLHRWFQRPFGTDTFVVGAHFTIVNKQLSRLKWLLLLGLLVENKVDLRSLLKMVFHPQGRWFLWNRREEILAILLGFRFNATSQR
jgi:hypothetical protein